MAFFTEHYFGEKMAQKAFALMGRLRAVKPKVSDIRCLLCADSPLMLQELLLCTDQAVYYHPRLSPGFDIYDFSTISAVTVESAYSYPSVCLTISNGSKSKLYVASQQASRMADYISSRILQNNETSHISSADEILKYKQLLDMGAITQEEFDAKKKQLLNL